MRKQKILGINIEYDEGNIRIIDSLKINKRWQMKVILQVFVYTTGFKSKRSIDSWLNEWVSHNRLYKLHLFRKHTKECDLEELEKRSRRIVYFLIGGII